MQRFEITPVGLHGGDATVQLACDRCGWNIWLDDPLSLAELVQRADEHTEVCR
jgi:hypothetical protein